MPDEAGWSHSDRVWGTGGVYVASESMQPPAKASGYPPSLRPPIAILDATGAAGETHTARNAERRTRDGCGVRDFAWFREKDDTTGLIFNRQTSTPQKGTRVGSSAQSLVFPFLRQRCQRVGWIHPVNTR